VIQTEKLKTAQNLQIPSSVQGRAHACTCVFEQNQNFSAKASQNATKNTWSHTTRCAEHFHEKSLVENGLVFEKIRDFKNFRLITEATVFFMYIDHVWSRAAG
jgi:hypothetical protein